MFNERSAQETRRQLVEKLAKMDEERRLLVKMREDVDAWLALNGVTVEVLTQPMEGPPATRPAEPQPSTPEGVEAGSLRALFAQVVEEHGARGLSARQVWEIAEARGATSNSTKPERAAAAALAAIAARGVIRAIRGKYYPRRPPPPPPPAPLLSTALVTTTEPRRFPPPPPPPEHAMT